MTSCTLPSFTANPFFVFRHWNFLVSHKIYTFSWSRRHLKSLKPFGATFMDLRIPWRTIFSSQEPWLMTLSSISGSNLFLVQQDDTTRWDLSKRNGIIPAITQRILENAKFFEEERDIEFKQDEFLSRTTFITNILYGNTDSKCVLNGSWLYTSNCLVTETADKCWFYFYSTRKSCQTIVAKKVRKRNPNVVSLDDLTPKTPVHYFKNGTKLGSWKKGFISSADNHIVVISYSNFLRGRPVCTAREDVHIAPTSPLLEEFEEIGFIFPCSYDAVHNDMKHVNVPQLWLH